jgi:hypothetical protein
MSTDRSSAAAPACETTSSRLQRQESDQPALAALELTLTGDAIAQCERAFLGSSFFQRLAACAGTAGGPTRGTVIVEIDCISALTID